MNAVAPVAGGVVSLGLWTLKPRLVYGGWSIQWSAWNHGGASFSAPVEDWWPSNDPTVYATREEAADAILRHRRACTPMGYPPD
jgi:hypothetical protein